MAIKPLQSITLKNDDGEDTTYVVASAPAIVETTEPADVASFSDGAEGIPVNSLIADINPVQSGSGGPSPSNVRPITGWTGMNVTVAGVDALTSSWESGAIGNFGNAGVALSYYFAANSARARTSSPSYFPASVTQLTVLCDYTKYELIARPLDANGLTMLPVDADGYNNSWHTSPWTIKNTGGFALMMRKKDNTDITAEEAASAGVHVVPTYTIYPISWADEAGTVYGGTLDVTNGLLTVTHKMVSNITVGNKLSWASTDSVSIFPVDGTRPTDGVKASTTDLYAPPYYCNRFKTNSVSVGVLTNKETGISASKTSNITYLTVPVSIASTKEEMNAWLSSNQTDIVAELENPQTYQLTPQAVMTILGQNNIWADTGDVEVDYCADTKLYIDKVIAAL